MFAYRYVFMAMVASVCLWSCATTSVPTPPSPPPPATVTWLYAKEAIRLRLKSDPQLNLFQRRPHALHACIYQLRDLNGLNQLMEEKDGMQKLLECGRFDGSVTHAKRIIVQPGRESEEVLDRADETKQVAVAAGYYRLNKETSVRTFPVPVVKVGMWPASSTVPGILLVDLHFGPQQIIDPEAPAK